MVNGMALDFPTCQIPRTLLHRIGYGPDPTIPPDWARAHPDGTFGGRFDDPRHPAIPVAQRYRVLYFATTATGAFGETAARWRPSLCTLAAVPSVASPTNRGLIPRTWRDSHRLGSARVVVTLPIVDAEDPDTLHLCRHILAPIASALGVDDIDVSTITGPHRILTQTFAAHVYTKKTLAGLDYAGVRYVSRLNRAWECWAFFADRVVIKPQRVIPIAEDDPSLHDAARLLKLDIEADGGAIITP